MAMILRVVWLLCVCSALAACSSKIPTSGTAAAQVALQEQNYQRGRIAYTAGKFEEAAALFASVVATAPRHLHARLNWAAALSRSGKAQEALEQCSYVLSYDPAVAEAYYQWGAILAGQGKHREAVEKFDQALAMKPMADLLPDDPARQANLQDYLQRQRKRPEDVGISLSPGRATPAR